MLSSNVIVINLMCDSHLACLNTTCFFSFHLNLAVVLSVFNSGTGNWIYGNL